MLVYMDYTGRWSSQQQTPQNPNPNHIFSSIPHALMYHQAPSSLSALSSHFSHQQHTTNPNPFLYFPQPVLPSSLTINPDLHPPGTDPSSNSSSYPSTHVGVGPGFMYSEDPGAGFHGWVSNQAEPISNDAVSVFLLFSCLISIGFSSQFCFVCVNFGFF
jgi:hypothetical protein